jgi:hypothetical protein
VEDLIRLRRVVQDAAPTLAPAAGQALHGQGSGQYECNFFPDAGVRYRLGGTADLAGLGHFEVSGSVRSVGFIRWGRAGGELTLSNACGSVRLSLLGPVQRGFSHLPGTFSYRVVGATGAYLGLHASGTLHLALSPASSGGHHLSRGTFTVSF